MSADKSKTPEEARKARAEYMREWHRRHPGKQAEYAVRYWMRRAQEQNDNETEPDGEKED